MPKLTLGKFEKALKLSENRALNTPVKNLIIIRFSINTYYIQRLMLLILGVYEVKLFVNSYPEVLVFDSTLHDFLLSKLSKVGLF